MTDTVYTQSKFDAYCTVTKQIMAAIEAGAGTCKMPWHAGIVSMTMPINAATEVPYRGINIVSLWASASVRRYITGYWASYKQWQKLRAQVRKGPSSSSIRYSSVRIPRGKTRSGPDLSRAQHGCSMRNRLMAGNFHCPNDHRKSRSTSRSKLSFWPPRRTSGTALILPVTAAKVTGLNCQIPSSSLARPPVHRPKPTTPSCFTS